MQADPGESYSVAERHPDTLADLAARLARARETFASFRTHPSTIVGGQAAPEQPPRTSD